MLSDINHSLPHLLNETFFTDHGRYLTPASLRKLNHLPFKDHPQLNTIVDILSRKHYHHIALQTSFNPMICSAFIEALAQHLCQDLTPHSLHQAELLQLDLSHKIRGLSSQTIATDGLRLLEILNKCDKYFIIVITNAHLIDTLEPLKQQLLLAAQHPKCRIMTIANEAIDTLSNNFVVLHLENASQSDILSLLKQQRTELEQHHHVVIPEELLTQAYELAERYLSATQTLDQALLLLDSSAARARSQDRYDSLSQSKPIVTLSILMTVLANWTQIPVTHLQPNKFKFAEFLQGMQQKIHGQDQALSALGHEIQQAYAHLQEKTGPFLSLLFAGPKHAGKTTTAIALVEQLFKKSHLLFFAQPTITAAGAMAEMKVQRYSDKQYIQLNQVMRHTPHAVILFDNIEHASLTMLDGLYEILATGYLHDSQGNHVNFRQAIIILNTTLGSARICAISKLDNRDDAKLDSLDLMDLVMSEQNSFTAPQRLPHNTQDVIQEIMPEISSYLPTALCQHLHIIPFQLLSRSAIENIIRLKLKRLGGQLETRHNVELSYAPEVIRFLTHESLQKSSPTHHSADIDATLKQLYICIEQAILNQADHKTRSNQLFLQLNETGHMLRCDWLTLASLRQHTT